MSISANEIQVDVSSNPVSESELVVPPPPLSRAQTKKVNPMHLHMILSICGHALKSFGELVISASNILLLLQKIITAAKALSNLNGDDLKQICLDSIHWLIEHQTNLSDDDKNSLDVLSENAFSQAFDLIMDMEAGCLSCCFGGKKAPAPMAPEPAPAK